MQTERIEQRTEDLERRVDRVEQILPTLATREDLKAMEERLRTHIAGSIEGSEGRLRTHVAGAIKESEERTRTHFDVVTESLRHDIQLVAEAVATLSERER